MQSSSPVTSLVLDFCVVWSGLVTSLQCHTSSLTIFMTDDAMTHYATFFSNGASSATTLKKKKVR